jgi:hypothetical protein
MTPSEYDEIERERSLAYVLKHIHGVDYPPPEPIVDKERTSC